MLQPGAANASPCGGSTRLVDSRHSTARAGLLGCNWLYLLELAKRRVLQPGAAVVPAGATLFCAGIQALTGSVSGFDFSGLNTYRRTPSCELSKVMSLLSLLTTSRSVSLSTSRSVSLCLMTARVVCRCKPACA